MFTEEMLIGQYGKPAFLRNTGADIENLEESNSHITDLMGRNLHKVEMLVSNLQLVDLPGCSLHTVDLALIGVEVPAMLMQIVVS